MTRVFRAAGDMVKPEVAHNLMQVRATTSQYPLARLGKYGMYGGFPRGLVSLALSPAGVRSAHVNCLLIRKI